jgi:hypothetical protein
VLFRFLQSRSVTPTRLDDEEQRVRIQKLLAETQLVSEQLSPHHRRYEHIKVIAGVGGLVAGLAGVLGLFLSGYQWAQAEKSSRRLRIEERLDRALALTGSESPSSRLAAVVSLSSL